jgi:hypothetical protein
LHRCMICPLCSKMNFQSLINLWIIRSAEMHSSKNCALLLYQPGRSMLKPCLPHSVPLISTLISRGLYLFSLLLRCIEHYSQVGSMTVAELRRENCVFFLCLPVYVPIHGLYVVHKSTKLSSQINLFFSRSFFFLMLLSYLMLITCYYNIWVVCS